MPRTETDAEHLQQALAERDRRIVELQAELFRTRAAHARRLKRIRTNIDGLAQTLARGEGLSVRAEGRPQLRLLVGGRS